MSMIDSMAQSPGLYALGWTLLHFIWQGMLLAGVGALIIRLLWRRTASIRYVATCAVLAIMAMTPPVTFFLIAGPTQSTELVARSVAPLAPDGRVIRLADSVEDWIDRPIDEPAGTVWIASLGRTLDDSVPMVLAFWIAGLVLFSLRLIGGWLVTIRFTRQLTSEAPRELRLAVDSLRQRIGAMRVVRVLMSARLDVPCMVGWLRPVIVLPEAILGLPPSYLSALLAHELAHIRRHDYLVNLIQSAVETLLFYHPAVWWISSRIRAERENCCDDEAVRLCGDPFGYAQALLHLETTRPSRLRLALFAADGSLLSRIRRVLGAEVHRPMGASSALSIGCTVLIFLATTVQWVGAESDPMSEHPAAQVQTLSRLDGVVDLGRQNVHLAETLARLSRTTGITITYPIACELMPVDHVFGHRPLRDDLSAVLRPHGLTNRIERDGCLRVLPEGEMGLRDLFFRGRVRLAPQQLRECVMGGTTCSCDLLVDLLQQQPGLRSSDRDYLAERLVEAGRLASNKLVFSGLQVEARRTLDGRVRYAMSLSGISRSPVDAEGHTVSAIEAFHGAIEKSDLFKAQFDRPVLRQAVNSVLGGRVSFNLILLPTLR